ncbi:DinB family protein [Burkholderia alba]|uniref:DinB family protein n=1 Tax=Burkholderia alba TaxID=2683677 RepID=UPI002B05BDB6|nr:DinB family protein [Burkholderia alba]
MNPITLDALADFPRLLEAHYDAVPAGFKHWKPVSWAGMPSEPLSAIEQVCHVRDIEVDGYHVRFARTLNETHPSLASLDTEALAVERRYGDADADAVFASFRAARRTTLDLLANLAPAQFERTAVFDGYGVLTLRGLVHYLCSHDQQHLAGLQWLLGKIDAAGRAA